MENSKIIPLYSVSDKANSINADSVWRYVSLFCHSYFTNKQARVINEIFAEYYNNVNDFGQSCNALAFLRHVQNELPRQRINMREKALREVVGCLLEAVKMFGGAIEDLEKVIVRVGGVLTLKDPTHQTFADEDANFVFVSSLLRKNHIALYNDLQEILEYNEIGFEEIENTNDIWCRDYMPCQVEPDNFILFRYDPSYLTEKDMHLRTEQSKACFWLKDEITKSDLVIDGGNIVRYADQAIATDFIFKENRSIERKELVESLKDLLFLEHLLIIPHEPFDSFGHADGMVSYVDYETVLINDYSDKSLFSDTFQHNLHSGIDAAGLKKIVLPYAPCLKMNIEKVYPSTGNYANFLQVKGLVIVPQYGIAEDKEALEIIQSAFPDRKVIGLDSRSVAERGGALNCITWNIIQ